jgi:M6 family metalloprotease-like protein
VKKTFTNAKSPVSIDVCKLQMSASKADRTGRNSGGGMVGFPLVDSAKNGMYINGTNEVLFVPIDFPDFPGDSSLKAQLEYDKKWMLDWYNYFSGGKSKFNVTTIDSWLRMPKERSGYPTDSKNINATASDSVARQAAQAQPFVDEISKKVDLSKFSTVYIFFPEGEYELGDFIIRNFPFKTKEGTKNLNYFSWGRNLTGMETLKWAFYIHETLHDFNIIGHAPGNGWPLGIMTNQSAISYAINPWEQFVLDWLPSDQIYCDDAATLKTATVSLSPVEREDKQTKMAVIKLSPTKAIVVESHGIDKWSSTNFGDRAFPAGFYSVMAYVVDLDKQVAAPVNNDGSSQLNDEWAWGVWQKVQGSPSNQFYINVGDRKNLQDYVAVLGDSFVIEGVRIKFVGTWDYETIEISKA